MCPKPKEIVSANWAIHLRNRHDSSQGVRFVDWCYKGEEELMKPED